MWPLVLSLEIEPWCLARHGRCLNYILWLKVLGLCLHRLLCLCRLKCLGLPVLRMAWMLCTVNSRLVQVLLVLLGAQRDRHKLL
jgi:hypothetical protein